MLTDGKPTQWHPGKGQDARGSAGVHQERGMRGEKHPGPFGFAQGRLGRPSAFLSSETGRLFQRNEGKPMTTRDAEGGSAHSTLRRWHRSHGEGADRKT